MTIRKIFAVLLFLLAIPTAFAAAPRIEIIAMTHPPVRAALQPLREWLNKQKIAVNEIDAESAAGVKRLATVGLSGHIPIVILINGQYQQRRTDGQPIALINFPNIPNAPAMARGKWAIEDVQTLLSPVTTQR